MPPETAPFTRLLRECDLILLGPLCAAVSRSLKRVSRASPHAPTDPGVDRYHEGGRTEIEPKPMNPPQVHAQQVPYGGGNLPLYEFPVPASR